MKTFNRRSGFCAFLLGFALFAGLVILILMLATDNAKKDADIARLNKKPVAEAEVEEDVREEPAPTDEHEMKLEETKRMADEREDLYFVAPQEGSYSSDKPKEKKPEKKDAKKGTPKETPKQPAKKSPEPPKAAASAPAPTKAPSEPQVVLNDDDIVIDKAPGTDVPPPEKVSGRMPEEDPAAAEPPKPDYPKDPGTPHYGPGRSPHTGLPLRR
ncbi:MAG: hypothetical protein J6U98_06065 [Abditibacteriota bacterium]|nr:hypothetical protein [Abditibacteriota bacterium]MBP5738656.1 hypothetical protein [Abditibacteriota bacterium]